LEDFRSRDRWWDYCRFALEFFKKYEIPVWEMSCQDDLASGSSDYCLCKPGLVYVVYLKNGGTAKLDLSDGKGTFEVHWYDPRHGGSLQTGTVRAVHGGSVCSLGRAPKDIDKDWAILVRPADPNRNYPPAINAGPFSARVTKTYSPGEDAYLEGDAGHDTQHLKVEPKRRVSYLKFHVTGLPAKVIRATLQLTEGGDPGGGTLYVHRGSHSSWSEQSLTPSTAPAPKELVGEKAGQFGAGKTIEIDVTPLVTGNGTYTAVLTLGQGGNDIWFGSKSSSHTPQLTVTAEDPSARRRWTR
ncbi:MAG: DNRLRE domain-containing protein, partial [Planctomycetes bacterium]|nr:DNRLRE domain-containing protein [Planctomycetota bacterium]